MKLFDEDFLSWLNLTQNGLLIGGTLVGIIIVMFSSLVLGAMVFLSVSTDVALFNLINIIGMALLLMFGGFFVSWFVLMIFFRTSRNVKVIGKQNKKIKKMSKKECVEEWFDDKISEGVGKK